MSTTRLSCACDRRNRPDPRSGISASTTTSIGFASFTFARSIAIRVLLDEISTQPLPNDRHHSRNLSVPKRPDSVHPIGHPISHSIHSGFSSPPQRSLNCERTFPFCRLPDRQSLAVGVNTIATASSNRPLAFVTPTRSRLHIPSLARGVGHVLAIPVNVSLGLL